jgi:hypothetical protein
MTNKINEKWENAEISRKTEEKHESWRKTLRFHFLIIENNSGNSL